MGKGIKINSNRRGKRVWGWKEHRGWTGAGKKQNGHNHRARHTGMDQQQILAIAKHLQQASTQAVISEHYVPHNPLIYCTQPLYGWAEAWEDSFTPNLAYAFHFFFSKFPVTLTASYIIWPMVKTQSSYEKPQPFSASVKGMQYSK